MGANLKLPVVPLGERLAPQFDFLSSSAVYAAAFVDRNGSYDGHSEPVSGAPMGLYRKAPDKIEAIRLKSGKSVKIVLAFDDSTKTP
jgi:hypothetical protein